ncbi:Crp/Fnr family transcriptional regulator [Hellea sp.]|nr:Crp/Fnr family transcriptional regulator [Hellea sp.]
MDILGANSPVLMDLLSEELKAKLIAIATLVRYSDGQLIHNRGDMSPSLKIVKSGQIQSGVIGTDGDFGHFAVINPGVCLGDPMLFGGLPRILDCFSIGDTELYLISAKKFNALFDDEPELARAFLRIANIRLHGFIEFIDDLRRLTLLARTAKLLLSMSKTGVSSTIFTFSQTELAMTLGVSRVSLGTTLQKLAKLKLIEIGYRQISVPNIEKLASWVEKNSQVMPIMSDVPSRNKTR